MVNQPRAAVCSNCEGIDTATCLVCGHTAGQPRPLDLDAIERAIGEYTEGAAAIAEIRRLRAALPQSPDQCDRCLCDECNGTREQHAGAMCTCEDCTGYPESACRRFHPPARITFIAEQLGALLSAHLHARARARCLFVAHAAHHALHDYDATKD